MQSSFLYSSLLYINLFPAQYDAIELLSKGGAQEDTLEVTLAHPQYRRYDFYRKTILQCQLYRVKTDLLRSLYELDTIQFQGITFANCSNNQSLLFQQAANVNILDCNFYKQFSSGKIGRRSNRLFLSISHSCSTRQLF
jgi:hypothetical protein